MSHSDSLLRLMNEVQHLPISIDGVTGQVVGRVCLQPVQIIPVVDHHPTGVGQTPAGGVRHPVDPPQTRPVTEMKVGNRVQSKVSSLL